ncbi:unnamed protein product [Phytophthora fragariaefolia]|uniref:Unnamed protein product n=1 Tax=Phytophthora fragariaefolia TaxID=1490495 RepID=A0A9W6Y225_9STRA|nr:unnamed protein product [Phytophthora fragariaefolia]
MADELTVKVVSGAAEDLPLRVDLATASVLSLKRLIERRDARRFPVAAQRLIFQGQILQDDKLLADYHVAAGCALHLTLTPGAVAAANAAADRAAAPAPPTGPAQLRALLQQMREREPPEQFATAARTLQKICANIVGHPSEDKYRRLRVDNAALKAKLFDRTRGQDCVQLLGFQDGGHVVLVPTPERWENLVACKAVVDATVTSLGGATSAPAASPFGAAPPMGGVGGFGGDFASQAQALLQNPAMLQSMASNPMVQQMAQQNPMLAQALQNPALLAQSMQALQQNPAMMQQVNQMMSDPNAMARMQQMMAGGGLGGVGGSPFGAAVPSTTAANPFAAGSGAANPFAASSSAANPFASTSSPAAPAPAAAAPTPPPAAAAPSSAAAAADTDAAFEEDEIAQAIARSLQDQ